MRRDRALARQQRPELIVLQNDGTVRVNNEADIEEPVRPVLMPRLGLRHDEHTPLPGEAAEAVSLRAGNVDRAGAREVCVIDVQDLVVETLQRTLGDGDQAHWNVEVGQPECRLGQAFQMFKVLFHVLPAADAPEARDQPDGVIRFDHAYPLRTSRTRQEPASRYPPIPGSWRTIFRFDATYGNRNRARADRPAFPARGQPFKDP